MPPSASSVSPPARERRTPRQVAREANLRRIKELALEQLRTQGAAGLSLRAIARELDLVSSAIYRYYASRDDLVTDLVVDAYRDLAAALEEASAGEGVGRAAWVAVCERLRTWALAEPHRYLLVYGSPIPGYEAPEATVEPAAQVMRALVAPALAGATAGSAPRDLPARLVTELATVGEALGLQEPALEEVARGERTSATTVLRAVAAVAKVHGLVMLEVNGQLRGGFEPADLLFRAAVEDEADRLGLG